MKICRMIAVSLVATCFGNAVLAQEAAPDGQIAQTPEEKQEVASGADASNPTAAVNFQDIRYRYFDLTGSAETHSFETEGAFMVAPWLKVTNELRGVHTNKSGSYKTDFEELKLRGIYLHDFMPFGIKAKTRTSIGRPGHREGLL